MKYTQTALEQIVDIINSEETSLEMVRKLEVIAENAILDNIENCLGYALRFWNKIPAYRIYYKPGHVINSDTVIANGWLPAEDYGYNYFVSAFDGLLTEFEWSLLKKYFNVE